jgi:ribosomal subunit interface protein
MILQISTQNFELTEKIKELVNSKLSLKLDRLLKSINPELQAAKIHLKQYSLGYLVKFEMSLPPRHQIFAQSQNEILTTALTELKEKIEKQILRYKSTNP